MGDHLLPICDRVIVINDGKIAAFGTYNDVKHALPGSDHKHSDGSIFDFFLNPREPGPSIADVKNGNVKFEEEVSSILDNKSHNVLIETTDGGVNPDTKGKALMTVEEKGQGDIGYSAYLYYFSAGGWGFWSCVVGFATAAQFFQIYAQFILADWGEETVESQLETGEGLSDSKNDGYLHLYATFLMVSIFCSASRGLFMAEHRMGASTILHKELLRTILCTSVAFFDTTPLGRILNRFSSDMQVIDENLSQTFSQLMNCYFAVIGSLGAVVGSTKGTFLLLLVPLVTLYFRLEKYFR